MGLLSVFYDVWMCVLVAMFLRVLFDMCFHVCNSNERLVGYSILLYVPLVYFCTELRFRVALLLLAIYNVGWIYISLRSIN